MAWVKQKVWVVTAWFKDTDEEGEPINWTEPSEEHLALSYRQAMKLKEELLQEPDIEDVWIGDEPEEREIWQSVKPQMNVQGIKL